MKGGHCNAEMSARVGGATAHVHRLAHTMGLNSHEVDDCAGKSIFSVNHKLIIAYGQIALLLLSINLGWQVSIAHIGGENSFGSKNTI